MSAAIYFQQLLHGLCEWGISLAIIFWGAQCWAREPAPFVVGLARHSRFWFALVFGVAPPVISALLRGPLTKLYTTESLAFARVPVSFALSAIFGVLLGIAAVCAVAPATADKRLPRGAAAGISAALIVVSYVLGSLLVARPQFYLAGDVIVATTTILSVARACAFNKIAAETEIVRPPYAGRSLGLALIVGFLPSVLVLATIGVAASMNLGKQESDALLWLCSIVSVFCCFGASIALFSRKTGGAIAGGIMLMLLNAFIAFFFGCCASVNLSSMH